MCLEILGEGGEKMETLGLCMTPNEKSSDLAKAHVRLDLLLVFFSKFLLF